MTQATPAQLFAEAQARILALLRSSPAADLERNLKALLEQTFDKMDLVTRTTLEIERERLNRLQARVAALEAKLAQPGADQASDPAMAESRGRSESAG